MRAGDSAPAAAGQSASAVASKSVSHSTRKKVLGALFYAVSSVLIMTVNKVALTTYRFPSAAALGLCQMVLTIIVLYAAKRARIVSFPDYTPGTFWKVHPLPLLFFGNLVSGLGGTARINLPMFTLLRRLSILLTMIAEAMLLNVKPSSTVQLSVGLMLGGALVAAINDLAFDAVGYFYLLVNDILTAANGVVLKKKLDSKEMGSFGLMYYNCIFSLPFAVVYLLLDMDSMVKLQEFDKWTDMGFLLSFLSSCIMGFVLTYSIYVCTNVNSALTTTVVGCLKNIIVAYLGMFMADYIFTWPNFWGVNISIAGSLLYSYFEFTEKKRDTPASSKPAALPTVHQQTPADLQGVKSQN